MTLEFIEYIKVTGEKFLGIACVKIDRRFIFRFKVQEGKDGKGLYIFPASYKIGVNHEGKDKYTTSFELDSTSESREVLDFVRNNVQKCIEGDKKMNAFSQEDNSPF